MDWTRIDKWTDRRTKSFWWLQLVLGEAKPARLFPLSPKDGRSTKEARRPLTFVHGTSLPSPVGDIVNRDLGWEQEGETGQGEEAYDEGSQVGEAVLLAVAGGLAISAAAAAAATSVSAAATTAAAAAVGGRGSIIAGGGRGSCVARGLGGSGVAGRLGWCGVSRARSGVSAAATTSAAAASVPMSCSSSSSAAASMSVPTGTISPLQVVGLARLGRGQEQSGGQDRSRRHRGDFNDGKER